MVTEVINGVAKEKVLADLEKYRKMAIDGGAVDAAIVSPSQIIQSIRSGYVCAFYTACPSSGTCYFCPPDFPVTIKVARAISQKYQYVLFIKFPRKMTALMGPDSLGSLTCKVDGFGKNWPSEMVAYWKDWARDHPSGYTHPLYDSGIAFQIEREARKDGYHFAFTCKGGSCNLHPKMCGQFDMNCLKRTGPYCRYPGETRPDGAAGMYTDFMRTIRNFGLQQAVGGFSTMLAKDVPEKYSTAYRYGIVYIV